VKEVKRRVKGISRPQVKIEGPNALRWHLGQAKEYYIALSTATETSRICPGKVLCLSQTYWLACV
jgi:hypothetical protein